MKNKVVKSREAVDLIHDGDSMCTSGFVGVGTPDEILAALGERFSTTGGPRDLTLVFAAGQGDGKDRGLNYLGHDGLLRTVIGGHWGLIPKISALALENRIEAYNLPQGVISHLYRDIAAGKPGTISRIGVGTFVDPRIEGGKINSITTADMVELITLGGEEWLFYKALPLNVAIIRGTTADAAGNITMEREALILDSLSMAMAARNSGGLVIAQVERVAKRGTLNSRDVVVPGALVDAIVIAEPERHMQTYSTAYSPAFSGELRAPLEDVAPAPLDPRKIIARRCALEIPMNGVVNLGIGMPEGVAQVASEERILENIVLTAEPGIIGGAPASGLDFGAATNAEAIIAQNQQFDFYDGGGLDLACLGMAECDAVGNVNVSRFGSRLAGAGGFINISQSARHVVFAGTFTTGGLRARIDDGRLVIDQEGRARKFVEDVQQITYSGPRGAQRQQPALYVTERAVFELSDKGPVLIEIAPGIDLERDVLALMGFRPKISPHLSQMNQAIFRDEPMDLKSLLLHLDLVHRVHYDSNRNIMFLNFEGMEVRETDTIAEIRRVVEETCRRIDRRVAVIVNYDGFSIDGAIADQYGDMVRELERRYYSKVSRYTTSAFMRMKLGAILERRVAPHIFESRDEAQAFIAGAHD